MIDRKGPAAVLLAALLAMLLTGCGMLADQQELGKQLAADGYAEARVLAKTGSGHDTVTVTTAAHPRRSGEQALEGAAKIVWDTYPVRFDELQLKVGAEEGSIDHAGLVALFGPRKPALDQQSVGDEIGGTFATVGIVVLVGLVLGMALIVLLVVLLVRRSRRRVPGPPPWQPGPPPGPQPWQPGPPPGAQPWQPGPPPAGTYGPPPR
jgi:hypothetical protein